MKNARPATTSKPPDTSDTTPSTGCLMTKTWNNVITVTIGNRSRRLNKAYLESAINEFFNAGAPTATSVLVRLYYSILAIEPGIGGGRIVPIFVKVD